MRRRALEQIAFDDARLLIVRHFVVVDVVGCARIVGSAGGFGRGTHVLRCAVAAEQVAEPRLEVVVRGARIAVGERVELLHQGIVLAAGIGGDIGKSRRVGHKQHQIEREHEAARARGNADPFDAPSSAGALFVCAFVYFFHALVIRFHGNLP